MNKIALFGALALSTFGTFAVAAEPALRIGIEAALGFGWDRWTGADGVFIGMQGFGASAPAEHLYPHFGITAEAIAATVRKKLS